MRTGRRHYCSTTAAVGDTADSDRDEGVATLGGRYLGRSLGGDPFRARFDPLGGASVTDIELSDVNVRVTVGPNTVISLASRQPDSTVLSSGANRFQYFQSPLSPLNVAAQCEATFTHEGFSPLSVRRRRRVAVQPSRRKQQQPSEGRASGVT